MKTKEKIKVRRDQIWNRQNTFDSRKLGPCDAYYRLLRKTNSYTYEIKTVEVMKQKAIKKMIKSEKAKPTKGSFNISSIKKESIQFDIGVKLNRFNQPLIPRMYVTNIPENSVVMWHKADLTSPFLVVEGIEGKAKKFSNTSLNHHDGFSHTFISKGIFEYHNGKARNKKNIGKITVAKNKEGKIPDPVLIRCTSKGFEPAEVKVVVGQTVAWTIYDINVAIVHQP